MREYYARKVREEEAWRTMTEGRKNKEAAKEIWHTLDWDKVDWAVVYDARDWVKIVLSRVIEKLYVLQIQEPAVFVGVEEDMEWIQRELMNARVRYYSYSPEELMEVAYDFEDVIDDLIILRSAPKQSKVGNWERCLVLIGIHKKLELINSNIPALPRLPVMSVQSASLIKDSIEERVWSDIFVIDGQSVANTVVSPVEEKVSALLSQGAIHPITKKAAMRVLDKLRSLNPFLKGLESVELDDSGMVWTEELSHVCLSAVTAINHFIYKTEQLKRRSWMGNSRRFLSAFGKVKTRDKLAVEMDKIYAKIQNLSIHRPKPVNRQGQSTTQKSIPPQPTTQEPDLVSFGDDVHAMISRLLTEDKSFRVIPIMGMEGIGRTTLAKLIFNHKTVIHHFPFGVCRSDGCHLLLRNKEKMVESDLNQLLAVGRNYEEEMQRLNASFIKNRSLIVLDHSYFPYEMLQGLQDTLNGSRMILTGTKTRLSPNLQMKSDPHCLRLRTDEESWALFTHALKTSIPSELRKLKDEIAKICGGLPLLIVKLAEELSRKDATIEEWSTVLQQFNHDQQQLWSNTLYKIHNELSLYMRRCLFYFTLFPQDFDIPARRLIALWVAEGLVQPSSISKLQNLQTLDVKHTSIKTLPDSIWKLQQL